jgi:hypothetical protein
MQFYVGNGNVDDVPVGNVVSLQNYGPAVMVPGEWNVYIIPLTDFGLTNGQWIYKFIFQQQGVTPQTVLLDQVGFLP